MNKTIAALLALFATCPLMSADTTETLYLSGTGYGDTRSWDFFCSNGMNSGKWTKIEVPSQWEQQGFGDYTYGRFYLNKEARPSEEYGIYRHKFFVPSSWRDKDVRIVFEGSMTDTDVNVNGKSAGPVHQGGFTEFSYSIADKLKYGAENVLEVTVHKESADNSVNAAERRADWWLFGGIYRPVYLEAMPKKHISRVAVDARADGSLSTTLFTKGTGKGNTVGVDVLDIRDGKVVASKDFAVSSDSVVVSMECGDVRRWDCEHPELYDVRYTLKDKNGNAIHSVKERIGFRTVEFRPKDGLYLNGTKLLLKGVNRHCFNPESGRTLNRELSLQDARLIKEMNMNAVRSHYAPDSHFLDICDSIGLLYLDELPGWHGKYNDKAGLKLLKEHIARDVNHPCVILWDNGNEGGWNRNLDGMFEKLDPQKRHVIHPWGDFNGIDTHHYPAYQTGPGKLANGWKVFMPTEFLHSRYDKGAGAGLEDFWRNYRRNPMFAGGFIWAFVDEAVARTDKNGWLDSDGSNGCDGIVGPHREKEGSFYTIRDVWAPVQFEPFNVTGSFNGTFLVDNEYLFTNFDECSMKYRTYSVGLPEQGGEMTLLAEGDVKLPAIEPGERGRARFELPENFRKSDILELEMFGRDGNSVVKRAWPVKFATDYHSDKYIADSENLKPAAVSKASGKTILSAGETEVVFDSATGIIDRVEVSGETMPLSNGPIPVGMRAKVRSSSVRMDGKDAVFTVKYSGGIDSIAWRLKPDGALDMNCVMLNRPGGKTDDGPTYDPKVGNLGLTFSYPEENVKGMKWLGRGPYRVWKNRQRGAEFGRWSKDYNNTITGHSYESLIYPEFKGYHGLVYWAVVEGKESDMTVKSKTDGMYLRMFTPEEPEGIKKEDRMERFPDGDISFLIDINAMRSFKPVSEHGPLSQPTSVRIKPGDEGIHLDLSFDFKFRK